MPEVLCAQRTEAWFAARRGRITASLAAACLGLDPNVSRQKAWREITGNLTAAEERAKENSQNFALRWGQNFEPVAKNAYEAETGNIVRECGLFVHPEYGWLAGSPDGIVHPRIVLETKCPEHPYERPPLAYRIQCLINIACTESDEAHLYCWPKPPETPRIWPIRRCPGIVGLIARLKAFYDEFITTNICPPRAKKKKYA